jgi:hypothetical protein
MEVHPAFPAATIPEFIAYAKANPGKSAQPRGAAERRTSGGPGTGLEVPQRPREGNLCLWWPIMATHRVRVNTLVLGARLPVVYDARVFVEVGGLMAYGPNFPDLYRRAGD